MSQGKPRAISSLADGREDGLEALAPLDPARTDSVDALVRAMGDPMKPKSP